MIPIPFLLFSLFSFLFSFYFLFIFFFSLDENAFFSTYFQMRVPLACFALIRGPDWTVEISLTNSATANMTSFSRWNPQFCAASTQLTKTTRIDESMKQASQEDKEERNQNPSGEVICIFFLFHQRSRIMFVSNLFVFIVF